MAAERTDERRAYDREHYRTWRAQNKERDEQNKLRYYARRIFTLEPEQIAELLTPRRASK